MAIVEGKLESVERLKESLKRSGITRFNSIGEIDRFLRDYEVEKRQLPARIERELEVEIHDLQSNLIRQEHSYDELKISIRNEIDQEIQKLGERIERIIDKSNRNIFYKIFYFPTIKSLSRKKSNLENSLQDIVKEKTSDAENRLSRLKFEIEGYLKNKGKMISERHGKSLDELIRTKEVVDGLYALVAGAIGESSVVKVLQKLSDDFYLINDFSMEFDPPIYNKKDGDRIFSIQIDHLLICPSGVFLLETKNWSKSSIKNHDLRSPIKQILRTNFALFVLLNSDSGFDDIELQRHHWGAKKMPIRNIVVMVHEKPKEEFKLVKVVSLNELIGYIQYFDRTFNDDEVKNIFEYLKKKCMRTRETH